MIVRCGVGGNTCYQRNFNYYRQRLRTSLKARMAAAKMIQEFFRARKERKRLEYVRREWKVVFRDRVRWAVRKLQGAAKMFPLRRRWLQYKWAVPRIQVCESPEGRLLGKIG